MPKPPAIAAPTRLGVNRYRAYQKVGVDPQQVLAAPKITHLIRELVSPASTVLGWEQALAALRASDIPEARQFLRYYDDVRLPLYCRRDLPIEAWAIYAGQSPATLWETIVRCLVRLNAQRGVVLAAMAHPSIVEKSIEMARTDEGTTDREWQLKHAGFIPLPKGNVTNVQVTAQATSTAASQSAAFAAPAPESTIRRLTDRFNELREETPAAPTALPAVIDAPALPAPSAPAPVVLDAMRSRQRIPALVDRSPATDPDPESEIDDLLQMIPPDDADSAEDY